MNPAVLGALIGAVPGTLAAALTTWAAVRAANTGVSQAQLTLVTEHHQWLRDKRSEVYVDLLTHAEQLFTRRHAFISQLQEITNEDGCGSSEVTVSARI